MTSGRDGDTKVVAVPRPADLAAGTPYLMVLYGRSAGELLSLNRPSYTVGRGEDVDFHVDDAGISRHHARITVNAGVVTIEDLRCRSTLTATRSPRLIDWSTSMSTFERKSRSRAVITPFCRSSCSR